MSVHPHSDHTVTAVDELVAAGIINPADRDRALTVMSGTDQASTGRGRLAGEISAYVGGVLVFTAAALFVGTQWSQLTSGTRAGLVAGAAALLAAAAGAVVALAHGPKQIRRSRADTRPAPCSSAQAPWPGGPHTSSSPRYWVTKARG